MIGLKVDVGYVLADPIGTEHGRRPKTYGTHRVCATPGCGTVLSVYNCADRCAVHDRGIDGSRYVVRHSAIDHSAAA